MDQRLKTSHAWSTPDLGQRYMNICFERKPFFVLGRGSPPVISVTCALPEAMEAGRRGFGRRSVGRVRLDIWAALRKALLKVFGKMVASQFGILLR